MSRENPEKTGLFSAIKFSNSKKIERDALFQNSQSGLNKVQVDINLKPNQWAKGLNSASPFQYKAFGMAKQPDLNSQEGQDFLAGPLFN